MIFLKKIKINLQKMSIFVHKFLVKSPHGSSSRSSSSAASSVAAVAGTSEAIGELSDPEKRAESSSTFVSRKTVEVVAAGDGGVYTQRAVTIEERMLVGSVKYDEEKRHFYDRWNN